MFAFAMARTFGATDKAAGGRVRNETDEENLERAKKAAETRTANSEEKD